MVIEIQYIGGNKMANVKIATKTKEGTNIKDVEITKMDVIQTIHVAKGVSKVTKFINKNDKLQNVFKTFNEVRQEVAKDAENYYAEQKKAKVKPEDVVEYDVGAEALTRTGALVWNDLLSVLSDVLDEILEIIAEILSHASGIKLDVIKQQELETFLDVFDAVVEVNDIDALTKRIKKSGNTFKKVTPMFSQPTNNQTPQVQQ